MQDLYLQLQNLKLTDKYCLIFIAALLLCLAIKILATDPLQNSINTSRELLEEKQQNLNNYLAFAEQYKDYSALQKQQNEAALLANELLPPQITTAELITAELIKEYTALAGKYNLRIESIKPVPQEKQKKEAYTSVTVNIVLTGSFYKAAAFLDDLQQQKRLAVPANVVIERSKNGFAGDVVLTASLTAYALK